jgi:hypothetical protein
MNTSRTQRSEKPELFDIHRAKSGLFEDYEAGDIAYIGNSLDNNAVMGFVMPLPGDRVFHFKGIVISAFCEATVQCPPFVACGRAGNGLMVLQPKRPMTTGQLAYLAAYVNLMVRWRFNWYRQTTKDRIRKIPIPDEVPARVTFAVKDQLPKASVVARPQWHPTTALFALESLYDLVAGHYHSLSDLPSGDVPVVSCGDQNNGISGYYGVRQHLHRNKLTIAFNGMNTLTTKYHPYTFAAKDDVAICSPKRPMRLTTELFIQIMLNRERWRFSYYRKCFIDKLRRYQVFLPVKDNQIDEDVIQAIIETSPYWNYLKIRFDHIL